jgi:hypothetical protein
MPPHAADGGRLVAPTEGDGALPLFSLKVEDEASELKAASRQHRWLSGLITDYRTERLGWNRLCRPRILGKETKLEPHGCTPRSAGGPGRVPRNRQCAQ